MMNLNARNLLLLLGLLTLTTALSAQCQYRIEMFDADADGWGTSSLQITSGSDTYTLSLSATFGDGTDSTVFINVFEGDTLNAVWNGFFFEFGVSFNIYNSENELIYSAVDPFPGPLFTETVACPSCLKPSNPLVENIFDTFVRLRWTPLAADANDTWLVIYGPPGFDLQGGEGDTLQVGLPKATLSGLDKKTPYEFYVVQQCDTTDFSSPAGPVAFETYWSDDVGIADIVAPSSGCDLGMETVSVVLKNYGANPQSNIYFRYSVNGIDAGVTTPDDGFYTGVLGKDSCVTIDFETMFDFSASGEYRITVYTYTQLPLFPLDEDPANDTFEIRITNRLELPYAQSFEEWDGGWYVDTDSSVNPSWAFGEPNGAVINQAAQGKNAWVTNLNGQYNPSELSYLVSPCFNFKDLDKDPVIEFSLFYNTEFSFDGGFLEMSTNDGGSWTRIGNVNQGINGYNFNNTLTGLGPVWAGSSNGWAPARFNLTGAAGDSTVRLRFGFGADDFAQLEGIGIDDIRIYTPLDRDLAGLSITTVGENEDCGLEDDQVTFTFANLGANTQLIPTVAYSVNGATPVVQVVGGVLPANTAITFTFSTPFDSRDDDFEIKCWTILSTDQNNANDTITYFVSHKARPLPLQEDFESASLPNGWEVNGFVTDGHNNTSYVLAANLYQFSPNFTLESPRHGPVQSGDSLSFDYRITDFDSEGAIAQVLSAGTIFNIQVSTNCGASYQTIYTINANNHTPSTEMQTIVLDLSSFAGESVRIRWQGIWSAGDMWFDLDNINLRFCPADFQLAVATNPADPGQANGSATVSPGAGTAPFAYAWSNGDTTATVSGLSTGMYTVTVTDALGCIDVASVGIGNTSAGEQEFLSRFSLAPNPTTGATRLQLIFSQWAQGQIQVVNPLGVVVWDDRFQLSGEVFRDLDLTGQPDGLYLVRVLVDGAMTQKKLMKITR